LKRMLAYTAALLKLPREPASYVDMLRFLYPIGFTRRSVLDRYTLEWCATFESTILRGYAAPRRELLTLLRHRRNAVAELTARAPEAHARQVAELMTQICWRQTEIEISELHT